MKKTLLILKSFGLYIALLALGIGLSSLTFWGIGNLIIWIFKINYTWTILHGLACVLVYILLKEIFSRK